MNYFKKYAEAEAATEEVKNYERSTILKVIDNTGATLGAELFKGKFYILGGSYSKDDAGKLLNWLADRLAENTD